MPTHRGELRRPLVGPLSGNLPGGDVDAVEDIHGGDPPPGGQREEPLLSLAVFPGLDRGAQADAASVDLAGSQVNQIERARRHAALLYVLVQRPDRGHRVGNDDGRALHAGFHGCTSPSRNWAQVLRPSVWPGDGSRAPLRTALLPGTGTGTTGLRCWVAFR